MQGRPTCSMGGGRMAGWKLMSYGECPVGNVRSIGVNPGGLGGRDPQILGKGVVWGSQGGFAEVVDGW